MLLPGIIAVGALRGELVESMLKRHRGVRDARLLPGFGGLLDCIDSLLWRDIGEDDWNSLPGW